MSCEDHLELQKLSYTVPPKDRSRRNLDYPCGVYYHS